MEETNNTDITQFCPSAQPDWEGAVVLGVVGGTLEEPRLAYLDEPSPATPELMETTSPVKPTEVFRIAAPCAGSKCVHFDGTNCQLVTRIVNILPRVADALPPCHIRPTCRWYLQEGKSACQRCPQVVTDNYNPSEQLLRAYEPVPR